MPSALGWASPAFDPGEGTQRQLVHAGVSSNEIHWLCVTHFHGDHCLGVPGVVMRIARDRVTHPVKAVYPASGEVFWRRLRHAAAFNDTSVIAEHPVEGEVAHLGPLTARRLSHPVESYGYRLQEPDGRRMLPAKLKAHGISGPEVGELRRTGQVRGITLEECSEHKPGQSAAFIMDTRICDAVFDLRRDELDARRGVGPGPSLHLVKLYLQCLQRCCGRDPAAASRPDTRSWVMT
ncbi:MBL fold metallo-hydrolase [Nonomuraea sp. NPDC050556]|uniref:MBL fold metallo-hydrolase n=1 Tax=Nonomuraea sp. NPDC050556 TaxID=3364369 RepID=UPI00379F2329